MGVLELEDRKKFFFKTLKNKNWGKIIVNLIFGVVFTLYFAQVHIYHNYFVKHISELNETIPLIFNRFRYSILSYSIMRERLMKIKVWLHLNMIQYLAIISMSCTMSYQWMMKNSYKN